MSLRLIVSKVAKTYGNRKILGNCSFDFSPNRIYALMGPNGSGKSTFLRICSLLEQQDGGSVLFLSANEELTHDLALRRRITLVLPKVGVFNTTVFKNVAYGLHIRGRRGTEATEKVRRTLSFVGLEHLHDKHAQTLSSGETQRLGIARALVIDPEILFLDEPTASVDAESTAIIEGIIRTLKKEHGRTVILTTHDRSQAERVADHLLLLKQGTLELLA